jgi:putative transposase
LVFGKAEYFFKGGLDNPNHIDPAQEISFCAHARQRRGEGPQPGSTRWRLIKSRFAKALPKRERRSAVRLARNERGI